jgi:serine/threonine protein kinase
MLIGVTPFFNRNKNILLTKIKTAKVVFPDRKRYKIDYSDEIMDLIVKLLDKDKSSRLGAKDDWLEILQHPVFEGVDVEKYEKHQIEPPFKPTVNKQDLTKYFNVDKSEGGMDDTHIPRENRKLIKDGDFSEFDRGKKKSSKDKKDGN